jgi:hypothetical protein
MAAEYDGEFVGKRIGRIFIPYLFIVEELGVLSDSGIGASD